MAAILLANFDEEFRDRLAAFLRVERHSVHVALEPAPLSQLLRRATVDLLIVDVSHRENYVRDLLADLGAHRAKRGPRPSVLGVSRVYRGPRFALDLERKGLRLIYV